MLPVDCVVNACVCIQQIAELSKNKKKSVFVCVLICLLYTFPWEICSFVHFKGLSGVEICLHTHHQPSVIVIATVCDNKHAAFHTWAI